MKKHLFFYILFCIITFQPAYAQKYEYTGHTPPTYINIKGEQYVRIPRSKKHYKLSPLTKIKPYIGLDIGYNKLDRTTIKDEDIAEITHVSYLQLPQKNISLSGILGLQLNPNISLEVFYLDTVAYNKRNGTTTLSIPVVDAIYTLKSSTQLSFKSYGLDAIYSYPIYNQTFQILASLGLGSYDVDIKYKVNKANPQGQDSATSVSNQSIGYRFGIGAQYNINKHFSLRTMLRYIKLTDKKIIDDMLEFSTGIRYYF